MVVNDGVVVVIVVVSLSLLLPHSISSPLM